MHVNKIEKSTQGQGIDADKISILYRDDMNRRLTVFLQASNEYWAGIACQAINNMVEKEPEQQYWYYTFSRKGYMDHDNGIFIGSFVDLVDTLDGNKNSTITFAREITKEEYDKLLFS